MSMDIANTNRGHFSTTPIRQVCQVCLETRGHDWPKEHQIKTVDADRRVNIYRCVDCVNEVARDIPHEPEMQVIFRNFDIPALM